MSMSNDALLERDISEIIGISGLPDTEREDMLANIGTLVLESAMMRIVASMTDEESHAFEAFVAQDPNPEAMLNELHRIAQDFDEIITEETVAFKRECIAVMERQGTLASSAV